MPLHSFRNAMLPVAVAMAIGLTACGSSDGDSTTSTGSTAAVSPSTATTDTGAGSNDGAVEVVKGALVDDGLKLEDGGEFTGSADEVTVKAASVSCVDVKRSATTLAANTFGDDWVHVAVAQASGVWELRGPAKPGTCSGDFATIRAADAIRAAVKDGTLSSNAVITDDDPLPEDFLSKLVAWRVDGQKICLAPSTSTNSDEVILASAQESGRSVEKPKAIQITAPAGDYCEPRPAGVTSPTFLGSDGPDDSASTGSDDLCTKFADAPGC